MNPGAHSRFHSNKLGDGLSPKPPSPLRLFLPNIRSLLNAVVSYSYMCHSGVLLPYFFSAYVCGIVQGTRVHIKWPYPYPYLRRHSGHPAAGANCNAWVRFRAGSRESLPPFALLFPRNGFSIPSPEDGPSPDRSGFLLSLLR